VDRDNDKLKVELPDMIPIATSLLITAILIIALFWHEMHVRRKGGDPPKHWLTTEGRVFVSRVREVEDGEGRIDYAPDVQCVYLVDNVSYTTTLSCSRSWFVLSHRDVERIVGEYPEGMTVTVRYDPQDPHRAVVEENQPKPPWSC
jgi:hypothetical protein